jgi:hypothetical protein
MTSGYPRWPWRKLSRVSSGGSGVEEAERRNLRGRSKMVRDELARALGRT